MKSPVTELVISPDEARELLEEGKLASAIRTRCSLPVSREQAAVFVRVLCDAAWPDGSTPIYRGAVDGLRKLAAATTADGRQVLEILYGNMRREIRRPRGPLKRRPIRVKRRG